MNRRGFLRGMLALGAAPAIVRADSLMKLVPRDLPVVLEMGHIETFRFVETPIVTTAATGILTSDIVERTVRMMRENHVQAGPNGKYVMFVASHMAREAREVLAPEVDIAVSTCAFGDQVRTGLGVLKVSRR